MSRFQIIFLAVFIFAIVTGLVLFSTFKGGQTKTAVTVRVWGTMDSSLVSPYVQDISVQSDGVVNIVYEQRRADTFYNQYVEAIINGTGPDLLLLPHENIWQFKSKITPIPYTSYPEKDFKANFIQEGELYLDSQGILAVPFTVDPLVMYWNRDIFTNALISTPPKYWEEFLALAPKLTVRDTATNITQGAVSLGEYRNVSHAKKILSLLTISAGNPITARFGNKLEVVLANNISQPLAPSKAALSFYTQFADPIKNVYSWNRSLVDSKTMFVSNKLAVYFGLASELNEIIAKNPNLNFDVAVMPQRQPQKNVQANAMTYGNMYGLSVARSSKNPAAAFTAIQYLTSSSVMPNWVKKSGLPSVRRDALGIDSSKAESTVFATSALISRGWIDPSPLRSDAVFRELIENVTSGRTNLEGALQQASNQLNNIIGQ